MNEHRKGKFEISPREELEQGERKQGKRKQPNENREEERDNDRKQEEKEKGTVTWNHANEKNRDTQSSNRDPGSRGGYQTYLPLKKDFIAPTPNRLGVPEGVGVDLPVNSAGEKPIRVNLFALRTRSRLSLEDGVLDAATLFGAVAVRNSARPSSLSSNELIRLKCPSSATIGRVRR